MTLFYFDIICMFLGSVIVNLCHLGSTGSPETESLMKSLLHVLPPVSSEFFLITAHYRFFFFQIFCMMVDNCKNLKTDNPVFLKHWQNGSKIAKNMGFYFFFQKFYHYLFLNLVFNESSCDLLALFLHKSYI